MTTASPHPLVTTPSLYVADAPETVGWSHLSQVLKSCGFVRSGGKTLTGSGPNKGTNRWTLIFSDVFHAEMALATLQGAEVPGINPPYRMTLSHASGLSSSVPQERLFPQFFKGTAKAHEVLAKTSAQEVFTWFRKAGPLVSVRVNVMVGHAYPTCVVEYWEEAHARYAWIHCRMMHPALSDFKPSFELRAYDPCTLACTGFGATWKQSDIQDTFSKFGKLINVQMSNTGSRDAYGIVTYTVPKEAETALKALNGQMGWQGKILSVRYKEPDQQGTFRSSSASHTSHAEAEQPSWRQRTSSTSTSSGPGSTNFAQSSPETPHSPKDSRPNGANFDPRVTEAEEAARFATVEQEVAEREERAAQDGLASATGEYDAARITQAQADAAVEEAERVLLAAKERQLQAAHGVIRGLEKKNRAAERERDAARRRREAVQDAALRKARVEEARRAAQEPWSPPTGSSGPKANGGPSWGNGGEPEWRANARRRQENTAPQAEPFEFGKRGHWGWGFQANGAGWRTYDWQKDNAKPGRWSSSYRDTADVGLDSDDEMEEENRDDEDAAEERRQDELRGEEEEKMREEVERRTRLEESIRRMKHMREEEENDRLERQKKADIQEQKKREEVERLAKEARDKLAREEKERLAQEEQQRKAHDEAVGREKARCQVRDRTRWNIQPIINPMLRFQWTDKLSISRFQAISTEFDTIKFCESQPATFESIPWPILQYPPLVKLEHIDWAAVEQFFSAAKRHLEAKEYKAMVEKAHRRFHPDKWRSRGLLNTVLDDDLRKRLEDAGNVVAQAITPLWLTSKAK